MTIEDGKFYESYSFHYIVSEVYPSITVNVLIYNLSPDFKITVSFDCSHVLNL